MAIKNQAQKPVFLLTNDDGYNSPGLISLAEELKKVGQVYVVAPDRERSSISMALTLRRPLRAENISRQVYAVDGTPADCVYIALRHLLRQKPDLLISGLNLGANLGCQDVAYSGTVAAALQGTFMGIPSLAVSLIDRKTSNGQKYDFIQAASLVRTIVAVLLRKKMPPRTYLNINIPPFPVRGIKITRLGEKRYSPELVKKKDPRGKTYFWIGVGHPQAVGPANSDVKVVDKGWVSITPLHIDRTDHHLVKSQLFSELQHLLNGGGPYFP